MNENDSWCSSPGMTFKHFHVLSRIKRVLVVKDFCQTTDIIARSDTRLMGFEASICIYN